MKKNAFTVECSAIIVIVFPKFYTGGRGELLFFEARNKSRCVIILKVWANYIVGRIIGKFGNYR